ncbi:MAG TPA: protein kinase [Steroidobacteraceae bacterium]|nr:protein kinase [Steroidobacteraceae bacterium]
MQADRWRRLEEIFQSALDCAPESRAAFIDSACGGDAELRAEVDSLLAAHEQGDGESADSAAFEEALKVLEQRSARLHEGRRIGPYRVLHELGRGGMGRVYLAARADQAFEKQVAIKVVERGLDTEEMTRRFQSEREILARLDHPNITRILDGGTTEDGLPFLVMEYVEGDPVDQYCDARALDVTGRLRLFQGVCAAVHYAHQNLIIHRDIKPANVLVTRAGVPRLLDFGIAKLVGSEAQAHEATRTVLRRLTPEYASPEQVRGEALTTASDVYSLGVLLYRLLSGQSPYRAHAPSATALEQMICEDQPERPSIAVARAQRSPPGAGTPERLRRRLAGDLDNVVLMALRKEPQRRYASVEQLSEDIGRHLANVPVIARPDTAAYRTSKFMRRHRTGVAATAAIVMLLGAGVVGTLWQARVARVERARAQQQFNDVRQLATSFLFEFNSSIQNLPGATPARKLLVQRALEYLSKLAQQSQGNRDLQRELAEAYLKVGDLQGNPYEPNLGDAQGAADSYRKALAISAALSSADSRDAPAQRYLARSYQSLGEVLAQLGQTTQAVSDLRKAAEIFATLVRRTPHDRDLRVQLADCYQSLGDLQGHSGLQNLGDRAGALDSYRKALAVFDAMRAENPGDQKARGGEVVMRIRIGDMQQALGDFAAALENYRGASELAQPLVSEDPGNDRFRRMLALSYRKLADLESQRGELGQALENARRAAEINRALAAADPDNAQASSNFALSLTTVADLLSKSGDTGGAVEEYRQAIAILEKQSAAAPTNLFMRGQLAETLVATGAVLAHQGRAAEARTQTARGVVLAHDLADGAAATPDDLNRYALILLTCQPPDLRDAAAALRTAERAVQRSAGRDPMSLHILAQAYAHNGDAGRAAETEQRALGLAPASQH